MFKDTMAGILAFIIVGLIVVLGGAILLGLSTLFLNVFLGALGLNKVTMWAVLCGLMGLHLGKKLLEFIF